MTMVSSASSSQDFTSPSHVPWSSPLHQGANNQPASAQSALPNLVRGGRHERSIKKPSPVSRPAIMQCDPGDAIELLSPTHTLSKSFVAENRPITTLETSSETPQCLFSSVVGIAAILPSMKPGQSSTNDTLKSIVPQSFGAPCVATAKLQDSAESTACRRQSHKLQYRRLSASPSPCLSRNSSYKSINTSRVQQGISFASDGTQYGLPRKLPQPDIVVLSDPYKNLPAHLRRHGLFAEAQVFAEAGMPANYVLHAFMTTAVGGPPALLAQSSRLLVKHRDEVARQMEKSKLDHTTQNAASALPESLTFDMESLDAQVEEKGLTPTHIAALHSSMPGQDNGSRNGMLLPIHALPYVLQCVSLPAFPSTSQGSITTGIKDIPIVALRVPNPQAFPTTHRFIYTHDTTELLCTLLPIRYITSTLNRGNSPIDPVVGLSTGIEAGSTSTDSHRHHGGITPSTTKAPLPRNFTVTRAVHALSQLPIAELLSHAKQVHAAWANGIAIGLLSHLYWSTLDRAWDVLMGAMTIKRGRQIVEDEMERTLLRDRDHTPEMGLAAAEGDSKRRRRSNTGDGGGSSDRHHSQTEGVGDHHSVLPSSEEGS